MFSGNCLIFYLFLRRFNFIFVTMLEKYFDKYHYVDSFYLLFIGDKWRCAYNNSLFWLGDFDLINYNDYDVRTGKLLIKCRQSYVQDFRQKIVSLKINL